MARVLLVDDDRSLLDVLSLAFGEAGHEPRIAADGLAALESIRAAPPELVVADVNMPRLDGFSLCRRLRESGDRTPIILLTSRDGEIDEALGLELGADDYVTKPFAMRVLLARVGALLRREAARQAAPEPSRRVTAGALVIDTERLEATFAGTLLSLTVTELRVLEALASRPGLVLARARLLEIVRGDDSVVGERIVDTYVKRLRRKLEAVQPGFECIETVIGAGYRWTAR